MNMKKALKGVVPFSSLISSVTLLLIQGGSRSSQMIISCEMQFERIFLIVMLNKISFH